jgi:hypothetical protein
MARLLSLDDCVYSGSLFGDLLSPNLPRGNQRQLIDVARYRTLEFFSSLARYCGLEF